MQSSFLEKLFHFFFYPVSERTFLILRRLWVIVVFYDVLRWWLPAFPLIFSREAPYRETIFWSWGPTSFNLIKNFSDEALMFVLILMLISTIFVWRRTRFQIPLLIVLVLHFFLTDLSTLIFFSYHKFIRLIGWYLLIEGFLWGSWKQHNAFVLRLIQLMVTQIYFVAFVAKLDAPFWVAGDAMQHVVNQGWNTPLADWVLRKMDPGPLFYRTWNHLVIVVEGFLWWAPWIPRLRKYAIWTAVIFHAGISIFMEIYLFPQMMILALLSFVRWDEVRLPRVLEPIPQEDRPSEELR